MSWAVGYDTNWHRDIGYGVPAWCDHPDCNEQIDRGIYYVCGDEPYGGDDCCGLYFCDDHMFYGHTQTEDDPNIGKVRQMCERCVRAHEDSFGCPDNLELNPFPRKPDHPKWINHKLNDPSWAAWRAEHPRQLEDMRAALAGTEQQA